MSDHMSSAAAAHNPLLDEWTGEHGGVPRFDLIDVQAMTPALLQGMDLKRKQIETIAARPAPPSFENTIAALEDSGRELSRATRLFEVYAGTLSDKTIRSIEAEISPLLAKLDDEIIHNEALFLRIDRVWKESSPWPNQEEHRLVEIYHRHFTRKGAGLATEKKARLKQINEELAKLYTTFSHNLLADEEQNSLVLTAEHELDGLPEALCAAAATQARAKGMSGKWVFPNTRSAIEPFLMFSGRRDLRERCWRMWISRGDNDNANNNRRIISKILMLRAERARLSGFSSHAHWVLDDNMARTPDAAIELMMRVWQAAILRIEDEVAAMKKLAQSLGADPEIQPWDYRYYAEQVRKEKFDIDQNEVKQYLQLDNIREGMFAAARSVFGIEMIKLEGIPTIHPEVSVYAVSRHGNQIGLWYFDPYARDGKRSGAWMSEYRTQEKFKGHVLPIVSNNSNFMRGQPGEPVLISWDDAITMFHEFGHALHGLLSNVSFPTLAGTNVKRDFVEFPSQVNERWLLTPEVLSKFAVHYKSGAPMPKRLFDKIQSSRTFNQGFLTGEYLASALYDMHIHLAADWQSPIDPVEFESTLMKQIGCPDEIVMRHRPTQFAHIFSDDSYSAGYYAYIWADTMSADASEAFIEAGSFYDKDTCDRFYRTIFSVGNSIPPDEAFRRFRGRDVDTGALMRDRGFTIT